MSIKISVTHAQEADEYIFKPGTLVIDNRDFLVMVSDIKPISPAYFAGMIVNRPETCSYNRTGEHCTGWKRDEFKLFTGTITMEQGE